MAVVLDDEGDMGHVEPESGAQIHEGRSRLIYCLPVVRDIVDITMAGMDRSLHTLVSLALPNAPGWGGWFTSRWYSRSGGRPVIVRLRLRPTGNDNPYEP